MKEHGSSILDGVCRPQQPSHPHSPLRLQNRVIVEVIGPDNKIKQRVDHEGNIMLTYGLNRLIEMLASDTGGATGWANWIGVGNTTTAAASNQAGILGTFGTGTAGGQTVNRSDKGNLTVEYQATWSDTANARTIAEVALCQTNTFDASGIARSVLGTTIGKATGDTVNISYQCIGATA